MAVDEHTPSPLPVSSNMQHPTGPIPTHVYPEHVSGAIAISQSSPPAPPSDDFGAFARWWKTAAIIASSLASIGVVVWWVGTRVFVEREDYESNEKRRDEVQNEMKSTLKSVHQTLQVQTEEFRGLKDNLQKLNTDLTVLKAVTEVERNRRRPSGNDR